MYSLSNLGLWLGGWPDQSRRHQHNLVARGAQLLDIFSTVYANITAAFGALLRGDLDEARQLVDQSIPLATQYGSSMYRAMGKLCKVVLPSEVETLKQASIP